MDDGNEVDALVIDNGSSIYKAGFAGYDEPLSVFRCALGYPKGIQLIGKGQEGPYIGEQVVEKRGAISEARYPIERGIITCWYDMEQIWRYSFDKKLCVDPREHPVLLTVPPLSSPNYFERMAQTMFETFETPAMQTCMQPLLSLFASGRTVGCVLESGHGKSHIVPIYEGCAISNHIRSVNLGGYDVTGHLMKSITYENHAELYNVSNFKKFEIAKDIKEKLTYVAEYYDEELRGWKTAFGEGDRQYELPDGQVIVVGRAERFTSSELLFQNVNGERNEVFGSSDGLHTYTYGAIRKCLDDIQNDLFRNIVLSGGNTMLPGFAYRMTKELGVLTANSVRLNVISPPERKYSAWIGGSILASHSSFNSYFISKAEYDESGPYIGYRKRCK